MTTRKDLQEFLKKFTLDERRAIKHLFKNVAKKIALQEKCREIWKQAKRK